MKQAVTSLDVARRAGVSQSAVSRVFTPGASASGPTVAKVRAAAKELGYRPNMMARSLTTGRSRIIGLVVAYLENQFYPHVVEALSKTLQSRGYHVLIFMTPQTDGDVDHILNELLDYQVDGIVMASVAMSSGLAAHCQSAGIPVVLFNRGQDDPNLFVVASDNKEGGRKAAHFLAANGHERIAYIAGWEGASTQRDREAGFLAGLKECGLECYARGVGNFTHEGARRATLSIFSQTENAGKAPPDAFFVANDHMAFAVMDCLRFELNRKVPEQVSVVGYDDVAIASWPAYGLTTVRQPTNRMVRQTVEILMSGQNTREMRPRSIKFDGPLIVRSSALHLNPPCT